MLEGCGAAVGHHDFAHHEDAVVARAIRINRDRLEHAVGAVPFGLLGRAAVKAPQRKLLKRRKQSYSLTVFCHAGLAQACKVSGRARR